MKRLRTLYVISNMFPSEQNVRYGIFVKRFIDNFQNDFDIEPVVMPKKFGILSKLSGYFKLYAEVLGILFKSKRTDVIYVHFPLYFSYLLIPFVLRKQPLALNFHGNDALFDTVLKKSLSPGLKWVTSRADLIVVPSVYYRRRIMDLMGVPDCRFCVYPSGGIDLSVFYPLPKKSKYFTFGFVSNFIREKGWEIFLEAIALLKEMAEQKPFQAFMVGDGPDKTEILASINEKRLPVRVFDSVPQYELVALYREFNVFVFPTYREAESLGLVGLEAMACGVPVLASKVGGPMGYVKSGYNGFLFEKRDSRSLARLMQKMMEMSVLDIAEMKENCVQSAARYESNKVKKDLLRTLNAV